MGDPRSIEVLRMNAFTDRPFSGNPAGVVPDADGLSDAQMQRLAPELNSVSETVFVLPPRNAHADIRLRYFTSTQEVDLCGHATISAVFALAECGRLDRNTDTLRAETPVGVLDLGLRFAGEILVEASMTQLPPESAVPGGAARAAEVLGIAPQSLRADLTVACCSTGIWACFVPLLDLDALASVAIRSELIESLWPEQDALSGVYPFVITGQDLEAGRVTTRGRFFSPPRYGIREDPVTGTASGALGGYLIDQGILDPAGVLVAHQGVEMGRPGKVRVERAAGGAMRIAGQAVTVLRGHARV